MEILLPYSIWYILSLVKDAEGYLRNVYTSYSSSISHARLAYGPSPLFIARIRWYQYHTAVAFFYISFQICRKENHICSTLVLISRNIKNGLARSTLLFSAEIFQKAHSELEGCTLILLTNYNLVYEMHHHHYCASTAMYFFRDMVYASFFSISCSFFFDGKTAKHLPFLFSWKGRWCCTLLKK